MYATMFQHHKSAASVRGSCFFTGFTCSPALCHERGCCCLPVGAPPQSVIASAS
eukprot:COSAG01_NODE_1256_length_11028_cov_10.728279_9_plen_54_part_00